MGKLYRFVEPVLLLLLKQKGSSHGYDLASAVREHALTDAEIEPAALYRTLRTLELNGHVVSKWETNGSGPARRVYQLTPAGKKHLEEWAVVLGQLSESMQRFVGNVKELRQNGGGRTPKRTPDAIDSARRA